MTGTLPALDASRPVLIAGPTASGKSGLALEIAARDGGVIVNADALQVFADWRILTARPGRDAEALAPHRLYGHVQGDTAYSVGQWLRDLKPILSGPDRPIIVGGTGLYFAALTEGLAEIPRTPPAIRAEAEARLAEAGLAELVAALDPATRVRIDVRNPARVLRAWEVQAATGRGLADWQDRTGPPLLPLDAAQPLLIDADRDWLGERIDRRFEAMIADGVLDEVRANLGQWSSARPASKAIGAAALVAHLRGALPLDEAVRRATTETRQYAKRQRTWFRARMRDWSVVERP